LHHIAPHARRISGWLPVPWSPASFVHAYESGVRTVADLLGFRLASAPLHWERTGSGAPVLLIMGLGLSGGAWWRTVPVLARRLEVITFDNRGVGRSHALLHAYTTEAMSDDAVSVLDAAGVDSAHVYGISLGGMVAQQLAIRHPERVRSLVLGATHAGGPQLHWPDVEVLEFLRKRLRMRPEEGAWSSVAFNYGDRCRREHPERIAEDIAQRLAHPFPEEAYRAQLWAAALHDCSGRLHRIRAPTLVVHGREDRMIPIENGRMLAERIPGARLIEVEQCGHLYPTEAPHIDKAIREFMQSHTGST
jgi:3-oxoadipate enol-lactonase